MSKYYPNILVFLQFTIIGIMVIFSKGFFSNYISLTIFIIGASLGVWALSYNRLGNFNIQPKMRENAKLITTGIYRYIRHPMYLSVITMMLAFFWSTPILLEGLFFISLIMVLFLKAKIEEKIWIEHDSKYNEYRAKSRYFIPFFL